MLKNLHMDFTQIFLLQNVASLASLISLPIWGRIIEKHGYSKILFWTSWAKILYVVMWAFVWPGDPFWPLFLLHFSQLIDAGTNLSAGNLLMDIVPGHTANNVGYFSVFTAITSVVSAIAPFLAGLLISLLGDGQWLVLGMSFGAIQIVFLLSGLGRFLCMPLLRGFES
jgi:MFS family permease